MQAKEMNYTYFYIKFFKIADPFNMSGKTRKLNYTVKLNYPIREAKFLKIFNIFLKDKILLVNCDLIDRNYSFTNINEKIEEKEEIHFPIFNSQIALVGYKGAESDDLIKIDKSKSLINEFTLSVENIDYSLFNATEIPKAFIKIKIYHD